MKKEKKPKKKDTQNSRVASNRQASHFYSILESMEAGLQLTGTEVKALRTGKCQLQEGFARFEKGELFLYNVHIGAYEQGNIYNHEPARQRKLLLHKAQLRRLFGLMTQKGFTIIPLNLYFKHGIAKCDIGLAKAKKVHDRRGDIKERMAKREIDRAMRSRNR